MVKTLEAIGVLDDNTGWMKNRVRDPEAGFSRFEKVINYFVLFLTPRLERTERYHPCSITLVREGHDLLLEEDRISG
jgi:hypothetical protein